MVSSQARTFHELLAATTDMVILPGVLGCRPLRRTVQVRLGTNTLRLPGGTPIFVISRQLFMKCPGYWSHYETIKTEIIQLEVIMPPHLHSRIHEIQHFLTPCVLTEVTTGATSRHQRSLYRVN
ncbi:MAG: hypothetical protein P8X67_15770 [Syntrophobacterales bacterium]